MKNVCLMHRADVLSKKLRVKIILLGVTAFLSCTNASVGDKCLNRVTETNTMGIDSTEQERAFWRVLNQSNYDSALLIVNQLFGLSEQNRSEDLLYVQKPLDSLYFGAYYMRYRVSEFLENRNVRWLSAILFDCLSESNVEWQGDSCQMNQVDIEDSYLQLAQSETDARPHVDRASYAIFLKRYGNSLRVQYFWARLNFKSKNYSVAIPIFNKLLDLQYYERPIYTVLFDYYSEKNEDSLVRLSNRFAKRFPRECNLGKVYLLQEKDSTGVVFAEECEKCFSSIKKEDSVKSQVYFAKRLLRRAEFDRLGEIIHRFENRDIELPFDDLEKWEWGEFYEIALRRLFLLREYRKLYKYVFFDRVDYSGKYEVVSENDFYNLVARLYKDYQAGKSDFDTFFEQNFKWLKKGNASE